MRFGRTLTLTRKNGKKPDLKSRVKSQFEIRKAPESML